MSVSKQPPSKQASQNQTVSARSVLWKEEQMEADGEKDSLDILPLGIIPLQSQRLLRARMLKNIRLESVVEMFANEGGGSGHVDYFDWPDGFKLPDQKLLSALGKLPSFDVYSTRLSMRNLGIEISNVAGLDLSAQRKSQLDKHMRPFTVPLMRQMLGTGDAPPLEFDQLVNLLRNPEQPEVLQNLIKMSERLHVELLALPKMLEDYADTFLSVAHYQEILDTLLPRIDIFLDDLRKLRGMPDLRANASFVKEVESLEVALEKIISAISARFKTFYRITNRMWENITEASFTSVRNLVTANQTVVGGVLCGLTVKLRGWENTFGDQPIDVNQRKRAQFIQEEIRVGVEKIDALLTESPSPRR